MKLKHSMYQIVQVMWKTELLKQYMKLKHTMYQIVQVRLGGKLNY